MNLLPDLVNDQDQRHGRLCADGADVTDGVVALAGQHDEVSGALRPGSHRTRQVAGCGHGKADPLQHGRQHCAFIGVLCDQQCIHASILLFTVPRSPCPAMEIG